MTTMEEYLLEKMSSRSRNKQGKLTIPAEIIEPGPAASDLQGPGTAPAGPILSNFRLKTRKSIQNKARKFQIRITPNGLGASGNRKTNGGRICSRKE